MFSRKSPVERLSFEASLGIVLVGTLFFILDPAHTLSGSRLAWTVYGLATAGTLGWAIVRAVAAQPVEAPRQEVQNPMAEVVLVLNGMTPEMASILAGTDGLRAPESSRVALDVSSSGELINVQGGRIVKIITPRAVELLCHEQREQLRTLAASLAGTYAEWTRLYAKRAPSLFHFMQRRIDRQLRQLAVGIAEPLNGVLSLLQSFGLKPDDQYTYLRDLVVLAQARQGCKV